MAIGFMPANDTSSNKARAKVEFVSIRDKMKEIMADHARLILNAAGKKTWEKKTPPHRYGGPMKVSVL